MKIAKVCYTGLFFSDKSALIFIELYMAGVLSGRLKTDFRAPPFTARSQIL